MSWSDRGDALAVIRHGRQRLRAKAVIGLLVVLQIAGVIAAAGGRADGAATDGAAGPAVRGRSALPTAFDGDWAIAGRAYAAVPGARVRPDVEAATATLRIDGAGMRWASPAGSLTGHCERAVYDGSLDVGHLQQWRKDMGTVLRRLQVEPSAVTEVMSFNCTEPRPDWGPDGPDQGTLVRLDGDRLLLPWYDRLVLLLRRVGPPKAAG